MGTYDRHVETSTRSAIATLGSVRMGEHGLCKACAWALAAARGETSTRPRTAEHDEQGDVKTRKGYTMGLGRRKDVPAGSGEPHQLDWRTPGDGHHIRSVQADFNKVPQYRGE